MYREFGAIATAAVTPFAGDGSLNIDAFRRLMRHLVDTGSDSIVVCGTTGESPTLGDAEKLELIRVAVEEVGSEVPIIAGTGSNDTAHSVELTRAACEAGAQGVLVVTPYYNKPPREGLLRHFSLVAEASSVPVILYNIPGRVVINLEPELVAELAQIDNVVAIKQANSDLAQAQEIATLAPDLAIYAGDDNLLLPLLQIGAVGGICVASHIVAPQMQQLVAAYRAGDETGARALDAELIDVYETLALTSNPIPVKAALNLIGLEVGGLRLPLVEAAPIEIERVRSMLERHSLLRAAAV
jgi:4-hydroxy-tetrahydrodipicolinate synthase